jgi:hypothetical protein
VAFAWQGRAKYVESPSRVLQLLMLELFSTRFQTSIFQGLGSEFQWRAQFRGSSRSGCQIKKPITLRVFDGRKWRSTLQAPISDCARTAHRLGTRLTRMAFRFRKNRDSQRHISNPGWKKICADRFQFPDHECQYEFVCSVRSPPERTDVPINAGGVFEEPYFALARS